MCSDDAFQSWRQFANTRLKSLESKAPVNPMHHEPVLSRHCMGKMIILSRRELGLVGFVVKASGTLRSVREMSSKIR